MSASWEIETCSGVKRVFKAGDVMLADDTTGEGHSFRVLGTNRMYLGPCRCQIKIKFTTFQPSSRSNRYKET